MLAAIPTAKLGVAAFHHFPTLSSSIMSFHFFLVWNQQCLIQWQAVLADELQNLKDQRKNLREVKVWCGLF